ncbi:VCBS domain-containing protein [Roseomonas harenae]|uniref:VCBS domain-containing protein n=1 Tax=Muricoccus harenae TaxID=2692566 RepID=UPI001331B40B|nr:VCBS domain-containing protein [Roseomonas harenae]
MAAFDNVQNAAQWGGYWGTSGRDQLLGTNAAEQFAAGDGNDEILAGGGDDRAYGGNGNDTVSGGTGNDFITGDAGDDVLAGDEGTDTLYGGDGNDTLRGGAGDGDVANGGSGADTYVYGVGDGRDFIEGLNRWEGDKVDLRYSAAKLNGITSFEGLKAAGMVVGTQQWGGDTLIKFSDTDILTIRWVNPRDLTNDMFLFAKPPTDVQITKSTVNENSAAGTAVGVLSASDPDAKDTFTYKIVGGGDAFAIAADGTTLVTKQSFDFEAKHEHSVTIQVTDQWGLSFQKVLTIAVGNVNEAPTVSAAVTLPAGTEDTAVQITAAQLLAGATDVDSSSLSVTGLAVASGGGSLVNNNDGTWTYTPAANANGPVSFSYKVSDGSLTTDQTASLSIAAVNDAPVIGTPTVSAVTEDVAVTSGKLIASGTIGISDADQDQGLFTTTVAATAGNLGTLSLAADGSYTYAVANAAVQFLGADDTKTETFTVESLDGTAKQVSFTINGQNDAAVIGTPTVAAVTEDVAVTSGKLMASGTIGISDTDQGQGSFKTAVAAAAGTLGTLTLAANGAYTYSVENSAVQFLGAGQTKVDTFTVESLDGTEKDISFTINGANEINLNFQTIDFSDALASPNPLIYSPYRYSLEEGYKGFNWYFRSQGFNDTYSPFVSPAAGDLESFGVPLQAGNTAWNAYGYNDWTIERSNGADFFLQSVKFYYWDTYGSSASTVTVTGYNNNVVQFSSAYDIRSDPGVNLPKYVVDRIDLTPPSNTWFSVDDLRFVLTSDQAAVSASADWFLQ